MHTVTFFTLAALSFAAANAAAFTPVNGLVTLPDGTKVNATNIARYQDKTYYINTMFQVNFYEAAQFCRQIGFELLSIQSKGENDFLGDYVYKNGWDGVVNNVVKYYFWASGINLGNNSYVWLSTGQPLGYTAFYPGEPNNYEGNEHCLEVRYHSKNNLGFNWNDYFCDRKTRYFICEKRDNDC